MSIEKNLNSIKRSIPSNVSIIAVSKTKPNRDILSAYNAGQKTFGENKVQELVKKQEELPNDIHWHMIGHLQTNKVKYIAPFVSLIHAVDSIKLLQEINKRAKQNNRIIDCLLQVHIATENTKFGFIFPKGGLCGADMGAAYLLPRIVGLGNASELLFFGDIFNTETALRMGFLNRVVVDGDATKALAQEWAKKLARGPAFAHSMTKQMIEAEHTMGLREAIEAEAQAQAICMEHADFRIAYDANKAKETPCYTGGEICND